MISHGPLHGSIANDATVHALVLFVCFGVFGCTDHGENHAAAVWRPDRLDGTYANPILYADYSDPDVIRVDDAYYMTSSSFSSSPGLPVLRSADLVNWTIIGHALRMVPPESHYSIPRHGHGVWAPSLRFRDGLYMIYYGDPDHGIFRVSSFDPAGPWSDPVLVQAAKGWIDPCPFWDDDGGAYLVHAWAKSRAGFNGVLTLRRMNAEGTAVVGDSVNVFSDPDRHPTIEGPKLYKRHGLYYIFAPAGGVKQGWQTVLRAQSLTGPYEDRIILHQGRTEINGPHQGAWIEDVSGASWFVHFQDKGAYGRITHLQPVAWHGGWPLIGVDTDGDGIGEPVATFRKPVSSSQGILMEPQTSDEFNGPDLGLQWQWQANVGGSGGFYALRDGHLVLTPVALPHPGADIRECPAILLQKIPAPAFVVTALMDAGGLAEGDRAGLVVLGNEYSTLGVQRKDGTLSLERGVGHLLDEEAPDVWTHERLLDTDVVYLRATFGKSPSCRLSLSLDGVIFEDVAGEIPVQSGRWVGARIGLYALASDSSSAGAVSVDWFRISPHH